MKERCNSGLQTSNLRLDIHLPWSTNMGQNLQLTSTLRKVFYGKSENWHRCRESVISANTSNQKLGLLKPSLNTDIRQAYITQ